MDLVSYLEDLPPDRLARLYDSPYTCQAVLRSLPPLAKQYVMRLLFLDAGIPEVVVSSWVKPTAEGKHSEALRKLQKLQILTTLTGGQGELSYLLDRAFQKQLRMAVCTSMSFQRQPVPEVVLRAAPTREEADLYARAQWERLLLYLVGASNQQPQPPQQLAGAAGPLDVGELLVGAGLALRDDRGRKAGVSEAGFRFLLLDTYNQLWLLLRQYITSMERSAELSSAVSFLLQLGSQGGQPVCYQALPQLERDIAAHMAQLGLVLPFQTGGATWLHPTRLAALLAAKLGAGSSRGEGFIIVETNYRVYAYTTSPVEQSILRLFVRCDALLPNLFVGTLTRESVKAALERGISAAQIAGYLRQHAHPRVATRIPVVPLVVSEQIGLWEAELRRLKSTPATLYDKFETAELYRRTVAAAQALGVVLFQDDANQRLVVQASAHGQMRNHIRALKEQLGV